MTHQKYTRLRKEYRHDTVCDFCPKALTSGIVTVLRGQDGREYYAGPVCAENNSINPKEKIPNLTKALSRAGTGCKVIGQQKNLPKDKANFAAIEYLLLRQVAMKDFPSVPYKAFDSYVQRYNEGILNESDVSHIEGVMNKVKGDDGLKKMSLANLKTCYLYDHLLTDQLRKITENKKSKDFYEGLQTFLRKYLRLSVKQKEQALKGFLDKTDLKKNDIMAAKFYDE